MIPLWPKNILYTISICCILRFVLWTRICSILVYILLTFEEMVYSAVLGWHILKMFIRSFRLMVLLSSSTFLLMFCLVDLSIIERGLLMFPTIIVDVSIFFSVLSVFASHISQRCYLMCKHLRLQCLLVDWPIYYYIIFLSVFGKFLCSEVYFIW